LFRAWRNLFRTSLLKIILNHLHFRLCASSSFGIIWWASCTSIWRLWSRFSCLLWNRIAFLTWNHSMSSTMTTTRTATLDCYADLFWDWLIRFFRTILLLHDGHLGMCLVDAWPNTWWSLARRWWFSLQKIRRNASCLRHIHWFLMLRIPAFIVTNWEDVQVFFIFPSRQ